MDKAVLQNSIRINHRGFFPSAIKRFYFLEKTTQDGTFSVFLIDDVKEIEVFQGKLVPFSYGNEEYYYADFSAVTKEGDYFISVNGIRSRQFVIYKDAYDICQRLMLDYFTYQRCGHPLGWHGSCHLDDGFIKENGKKVDLSGGYHQSCDLRKSPGGVSIGVLCMMRFALNDRSEWGKIRLNDEIKWACDYYVKTIQQSGAMYNTLNAPFGWGAREFYETPAPSSAQWNVTSILATGSLFFKEIDSELSKKYLNAALCSYNFMKGENRSRGVYKHPEKYPMGMDPDFFYDQCEIGTTPDIAYEISACCDLFKVTNNSDYLKNAENKLSSLLKYLDGFVLLRNGEKNRTVWSSCSYTWLASGLLSLCQAYEILGDTQGLKQKIIHALEDIKNYMSLSPLKKVRRLYTNEDLDFKCDHLNRTVRDAVGTLSSYRGYYYSLKESFEPSIACYIGTFVAKASRLLGTTEYLECAQAIADDLLGGNELDSSRVRGIGYNNPQHHAYGQFFPSTPFLPGAVGVGYSTIDVYENTSEYDMPCVGLAMYMLSELKENYNEKVE